MAESKNHEMPEEELREAEENLEELTPEDESMNAEASEEAVEKEEKEPVPETKKTFPGKKKKKDPRDEKIEELTDQLKRLMAEFENYRKRTEKEKAQTYDLGASNVLLKLLPVVDNFERGIASIPEDERESAVYTGMDMIYKQLEKTLEDLGVTPMDAEGKPFDPNLHNAVMQAADERYPDGSVVMELQKGYIYKDSVLRHAMVSVNDLGQASENEE